VLGQSGDDVFVKIIRVKLLGPVTLHNVQHEGIGAQNEVLTGKVVIVINALN